TLTQFLAVEHGTAGDGSGGSHDELSAFLNAGALTLTVEVTDNDGDTDSDSFDLGAVIAFEDAGPSVSLAPVAGATLVIDESLGETTGNETEPGGNLGTRT